MEGYQIELIKSKQFQDVELDAWRMNTLILDLKRQLLVLGCTNYLLFFSITGLKLKQLKPIQIEQNDMINQIKQYDHLLFAITMNSYIYIYDLDNILIKPIKLQGLYEKIADCSIWSIDICQQYLAVGSNSHIISLWSRKLLAFDKPDHKYWDDREVRVKFNKQDLMKTDIEFPIRYSIQNHKHNIPCVSFSPCCQYLASGSIDGGLRIYLVENGTQLYSIIFSEWVWCISWIQLNDYTQISSNSEFDQLAYYNIVAGFKDQIKICQVINKEFKVVDDNFYKNSSQLGQRFQRLQYLQDLNLIVAFPQHDKQFCLIELYNLDRIVKFQDLKVSQFNFSNFIDKGVQLNYLQKTQSQQIFNKYKVVLKQQQQFQLGKKILGFIDLEYEVKSISLQIINKVIEQQQKIFLLMKIFDYYIQIDELVIVPFSYVSSVLYQNEHDSNLANLNETGVNSIHIVLKYYQIYQIKSQSNNQKQCSCKQISIQQIYCISDIPINKDNDRQWQQVILLFLNPKRIRFCSFQRGNSCRYQASQYYCKSENKTIYIDRILI